MTGTTLSALAASLLSLLFSYFPAFKSWYNPKSPDVKRLIMLVLVIFVAFASYGFACAGLADAFNVSVTCDALGAWGLVEAVIAAIAANQATFLISPGKPKDDQPEVIASKRPARA